jgi:hypothetical protein
MKIFPGLDKNFQEIFSRIIVLGVTNSKTHSGRRKRGKKLPFLGKFKMGNGKD